MKYVMGSLMFLFALLELYVIPVQMEGVNAHTLRKQGTCVAEGTRAVFFVVTLIL